MTRRSPVLLVLLACAVLLAIPAARAQPAAPDSTLPLAPEVRTGTLDNGLRYFIRPNTEPEDRAELRLVVDAGSVQETDAQQGLAHFVEHMLFNGTEQFEKQELVDFLERIGMRFGPDVNAYTSFDETVYELTIPTDSSQIVETAFDVLEQWAAHATLTDEEIEKERGVIIEEWRARLQSAEGRLQEETLPALLHASRYAERLPIGDTSVVKNAAPETLRDFYRTWYRPNLMAVVVVGDLKPARAEALIRERFADLQNPAEPAPRPTYDVPPHEETQYAIATDPEFPVSIVSVAFKKDAQRVQAVSDYRRLLVTQLFYGILNARLDEKARTGTVPFLRAGAYQGGLVRPTTIYGLQAQVPDDSIEAGLRALLVEAARIRQHGVTPTELVRQKREVERAYEQAYKDRENIASSRLAQELVQLFLEGDAAPGIAAEYALVQQLLPQITTADVNERAEDLFAQTSRVVTVRMPEKEDLSVPTEQDLAAVLEAVQQMDVPPYEDAVSDVPLMPEVPAPAGVAERSMQEELGVTEWTLSNGVRVILKPTDFKEDEVLVRASSPGGLSLVPDSTYATARHASAVVGRSGVGTFTQTALEKKLAGKSVSLSANIGDREEGFSGSASPEDLETLFQLIHLSVTAPRADSTALVAYQKQQRAYLQNRSSTPGAAFQDTLLAALYGDHPRVGAPTIAEVNALDREALLAVYQERFADTEDFTFTVTGNVAPDTLETLARIYLATLPTTARTDSVRDAEPDLPEGVVEKTIRAGIGERSRVLLLYHGPVEYTRAERHKLETLEDVLSIRLREELREARSGVYGVGVSASTRGAPDPRYTVSVSFVCDPGRAEELIAAARAEIDSVRTGGVTADDVAKVKEQQRRSRETALETNGFWASALDFAYTTPGEDPAQILQYLDLVEAITPAQVTETAQTYLREDRYVLGVLYPEDAQPAEGVGVGR